ncbi:Kti12p KNAG_0A06410 [Huiozyma naganishii CBS 8797]|uniref:Protein KTI12 n=1 Tax=Huiozyma naganishii (strain ATCC MYA-139 / BCRC 22969 / CBS 8797 / KCTC 17520 / NBRC 10181 / NCYC 3082 / Yp74L-3) TaxID=1071383 RepID=J7R0H2_HUIN7|nr:hypothetical protein KNAG_0A06410 [Kazachstania naganishii CBS 8797]CCK68300.1 hypothetical protein KNAG_0A06410 [Kazachstania naganishii CBS 8797]
MPLVLFTGYPSSGKTTYAKELCSLLERKIEEQRGQLGNYRVVYHSDESLGISHEDYRHSQDERKLRNKITSAVRRDLSRNNIVVVDSLNYIKGFRYQLHCEVKNLATSFVLVQTLCPVGTVKSQWNKTWPEDLLDELVARYEEPNPANRWDSPLIPLLTGTDTLQSVIEDLYKIVFPSLQKNGGGAVVSNAGGPGAAVQKPNAVTVLKPASQSDFVHLLDKETSEINKLVLDTIRDRNSIGLDSQGHRIIVNGKDINDPQCLFVELPLQQVNIVKLQRLKRQFIQLNKVRDLNTDRILPTYIDFLNKNLSN